MIEPHEAVLRGAQQIVGGNLAVLARRENQTSSFHGLRYSRCRYLRAALWGVVSVFESQSIRSLLRSDTLPSSAVAVERCPISISLIGRCRVFTQSRKFAQCAMLALLLLFTSTGCKSEPFSGKIS